MLKNDVLFASSSVAFHHLACSKSQQGTRRPALRTSCPVTCASCPACGASRTWPSSSRRGLAAWSWPWPPSGSAWSACPTRRRPSGPQLRRPAGRPPAERSPPGGVERRVLRRAAAGEWLGRREGCLGGADVLTWVTPRVAPCQCRRGAGGPLPGHRARTPGTAHGSWRVQNGPRWVLMESPVLPQNSTELCLQAPMFPAKNDRAAQSMHISAGQAGTWRMQVGAHSSQCCCCIMCTINCANVCRNRKSNTPAAVSIASTLWTRTLGMGTCSCHMSRTAATTRARRL